MKTFVKITLCSYFIGCTVLFLQGCKKEDQTGSFSFYMTDAPAAYTEVNVDVIGMRAHNDVSGWIEIPVKAGAYNLLELQNDVTVLLANKVEVPVGHYSQIRLLLGSNNSIKADGVLYPLTIPSGEESGLKIKINEELSLEEHVSIVLDFDAAASVVVNGNGSYHLKPVISVKSKSSM